MSASLKIKGDIKKGRRSPSRAEELMDRKPSKLGGNCDGKERKAKLENFLSMPKYSKELGREKPEPFRGDVLRSTKARAIVGFLHSQSPRRNSWRLMRCTPAWPGF